MFSSPDEKTFNIGKSPTSSVWKRRSPGSIPPRTVWKPQSHWLVTVSWNLRAGRVVSLANVEVSPHPGRTRSHSRIGKSSISLRPQQPGNREGDCSQLYRLAGYRNSNPTGWLLPLKEIPRKEGYASGQRRSPAAPREDRVSSPAKKCFYVCTIRTRAPTKAVILQVDTARNGVKTSTPLAGC